MAKQKVTRRKATRRTPTYSPAIGLGPVSAPDRYLDKALDEKQEMLFNIQAIVVACAHGIEENFGELMDSAENNFPSYSRALLEAGRMIDRACGDMEMSALRVRAVALETAAILVDQNTTGE